MTRVRPPRAAAWLLRQALPPGDAGASILGDLLEELESAGNTRAARRRLSRHAWSIALRYALRPSPTLSSIPHGEESMGLDALKQDLRFALRSIAKQPSCPVR